MAIRLIHLWAVFLDILRSGKVRNLQRQQLSGHVFGYFHIPGLVPLAPHEKIPLPTGQVHVVCFQMVSSLAKSRTIEYNTGGEGEGERLSIVFTILAFSTITGTDWTRFSLGSLF